MSNRDLIDKIMDKIDMDLRLGLEHRDLVSLRSRVRYALRLALAEETEPEYKAIRYRPENHR